MVPHCFLCLWSHSAAGVSLGVSDNLLNPKWESSMCWQMDEYSWSLSEASKRGAKTGSSAYHSDVPVFDANRRASWEGRLSGWYCESRGSANRSVLGREGALDRASTALMNSFLFGR